jgi:RNA polymerase sigma factor (sigma-70 family)
MPGVSDDRASWLAEHVLPHERGLRAWLAQRRVVDLDVDDIVQETYAVLAELKSVEHIRNPRTYLFSVAHSIILQHVRRQRIVSIEAMADLDQLGIYSDEPTPEEALAEFQELRGMAQLIAGLPGKCREAFTLRKVEGLSQRDIAGRMRISESTVEKHIGRALKLLMSAMRGAGTAEAQSPTRTQASPRRRRIERQADE